MKKAIVFKLRGNKKELNFGKSNGFINEGVAKSNYILEKQKKKQTDLNMNISHVSTLSVVASSSLSFVVMLLSLL